MLSFVCSCTVIFAAHSLSFEAVCGGNEVGNFSDCRRLPFESELGTSLAETDGIIFSEKSLVVGFVTAAAAVSSGGDEFALRLGEATEVECGMATGAALAFMKP